MIERQIITQKIKEYQIQEFVSKSLKNVGYSHTKVQRTPLGEKIIIFASRPGLIVGRKGQNIKKLTADLKKKFDLENPQIEVSEIENINLDANIVAERIASSMERFGSSRFKGIGHRVMADVMNAGALGIEILISGKIPSARAKSWRFYTGYLKKCGDIAIEGVKKANLTAELKSGTVGIKISIMPPDIVLPDDVKLGKEKVEVVKEVKEGERKEVKEEEKEEKKEVKEKKDKSKEDVKKDKRTKSNG